MAKLTNNVDPITHAAIGAQSEACGWKAGLSLGMGPKLSARRFAVPSRNKTALFLGKAWEPTAFPVGLLNPSGLS